MSEKQAVSALAEALRVGNDLQVAWLDGDRSYQWGVLKGGTVVLAFGHSARPTVDAVECDTLLLYSTASAIPTIKKVTAKKMSVYVGYSSIVYLENLHVDDCQIDLHYSSKVKFLHGSILRISGSISYSAIGCHEDVKIGTDTVKTSFAGQWNGGPCIF